MKIVKEGKATVEFGKIYNGGVFSYGDIFYIKIKGIVDCDGEAVNAVDLSDGEVTSFEGNNIVASYPNAALVIK